MSYPVIITLLHHPDDLISDKIRDGFIDHFDRLGMDRDGIHMRVPVRLRSLPLSADGALRPIVPRADRLDVIVLLQSDEMREEAAPWRHLLAAAEAAFEQQQREVLPILVALEEDSFSLPAFAAAQRLKWFDWQGLAIEARARRLMIHVVNGIRRRLARREERERIFISHAKADGKVAAEKVLRHIQDPSNGLTLETFYDARELEIGESWEAGLEQGATEGTLLALVTDRYDTRIWCNQEILWGKERSRPIVLVDLRKARVGRTFPYGGNLPLIRDLLNDEDGIERVLLEVVSEALRCDLFRLSVSGLADDEAIALPRPPELCDLVFFADVPETTPIIYPDPPLSKMELGLLERAAGSRPIRALGEIS